MKYLLALLTMTILIGNGCTKSVELQQDPPLTNWLGERYFNYRILEIQNGDSTETFYCNMPILLEFNTHFGNFSPNIFDFNGTGTVDVLDQMSLNSGFGQVADSEINFSDVTVSGQFSSGWMINIPGWEVAFLKVTPYDETPAGSFIPDELNSFFIEGVKNNKTIKTWYHAW